MFNRTIFLFRNELFCIHNPSTTISDSFHPSSDCVFCVVLCTTCAFLGLGFTCLDESVSALGGWVFVSPIKPVRQSPAEADQQSYTMVCGLYHTKKKTKEKREPNLVMEGLNKQPRTFQSVFYHAELFMLISSWVSLLDFITRHCQNRFKPTIFLWLKNLKKNLKQRVVHRSVCVCKFLLNRLILTPLCPCTFAQKRRRQREDCVPGNGTLLARAP